MRDYGKVAPQFWTGETGRKLKASGPEAVIVAMYLMTSPHANMIGLYYLPKPYIAHETGLDIEGACKGLARAIEAGFCTFDEASEHVFVHEMARFQIGTHLRPNDKRCAGVANELMKAPESALRLAFWRRYKDAFHLPNLPKTTSPLEGASKPLRSQEQEQEQEQEKKKDQKTAPEAEWFAGVPEQVVRDFKALRRKLRAEITKTAMDGIRREAGKASISLTEALTTCCERGWRGFKAEWVQGGNPSAPVTCGTPRRRRELGT